MRVIAGIARSLILKSPEGDHTRPTTDKYKETLFNVLQPYVGGGVFVDLFSGSGAIGIEALSRGAKKAYFVDDNMKANKCIIENLKHTKLIDNAIVLKQDAAFALAHTVNEPIDILFLDPPYKDHKEVQVLEVASESKFVTEDTIIVVECDYDAEFAFLDRLGLEIYKSKEYKNCQHVFIRRVISE